ncbi:hypothetical protein [Marinospirillum perlucidum]|uniref:hypothetical protein n=1 Tax=Marinospirillum perlucidum TaxID=1982602 RepID=UPI001390125D|nr:hypothetical protein [Marinospirillum perlucidum]
MRSSSLVYCFAFLVALQLTACSDPGASSSGSTTTASASLSARLPQDHQAQAAYLDPATRYIEVTVRETDVLGFNVPGYDVNEPAWQWRLCYSELYYEAGSVEPDAASVLEQCGHKPGSDDFPLATSAKVIGPDQPVVEFNELEVDKTYRFKAVLYDGDPASATSQPLAEATTFATLQAGNNPLVLNMLQGTWEVANTSSVQLQLLNRDPAQVNVLVDDPNTPEVVESLTYFNPDDSEAGGGTGFTWQQSESTTATTPAQLLGLTSTPGNSLVLERFHVGTYDYYLTDGASGTAPTGVRTLEEYPEYAGPVTSMPLDMMMPHKLLLELTEAGSTAVSLGEGFTDVIISGGINAYFGMDLSASLLQQYRPDTGNQHLLSLGQWSVDQSGYSEWGDTAYAGLHFLDPLDGIFKALNEGSFQVSDPEIVLDRYSIVSDSAGYQVKPGLNIAQYSFNDRTSTFTLSSGYADDFTGLLEAQALQFKDAGTLEGTLLEYMGYDRYEMASSVLPFPDQLQENSEGELEVISTTTLAAGVAAAASSAESTLTREERKARFLSWVNHMARLHWISDQLGVSAASVPACFVESFSEDYLGYSWYELGSDGIWRLGAITYGEWYKDANGEIIRNTEGEVIYFNSTTGTYSESGWTPPADSSPVYGIVEIDTSTQPTLPYQETGAGESEICLQPVRLEATGLNAPAGF